MAMVILMIGDSVEIFAVNVALRSKAELAVQVRYPLNSRSQHEKWPRRLIVYDRRTKVRRT